MLADIEHFHERGLLPPVSRPEIEGQRAELGHRQVELRATVQQLNYQLEDLLGVEIAADARFWPQTSLTVSTITPNKDEAVNLALANRADLAELRLAAGADGRDSVAAARTILPLAAGGLGSSSPPSGCLAFLLHPGSSGSAGAIRSQQLAELLADRQRTVRHETLQAVVIVETRLDQIGLTRRRLDIAKDHLRATEQAQELAVGAPLNVRKARLDVTAIEQDLLHDVIEWKLAMVKLREAQGLLAVECGYDSAARTAGPLACRP
jgi:outer membrane protein TolC